MKILYIVQYFTTLNSSASSRHWWATHYLKEKGWDVTVITGPGYLPKQLQPKGLWAKVHIDGITVIILNISYSQKMGFIGRGLSFIGYLLGASIVALCMQPKPALVFASSTPLTVAVPALFAHIFRRIPFVFEARDLWPDGPVELGKIKNTFLKYILYRLESLTYRLAEKIITLSPGMFDGIVKKGICESKIFVIPNSSDPEFFSINADGAAFLKKHGISGNFVCAHAGTMGFVNGLDIILDAALLLKNSHPHIVFLLIGDGNERPHLEKRVGREHINNVIFIAPIPKHEMPSCLAAVDLGLMTIKYFKIKEQNCANKFFDYLASGTPVLLNYGGWQAEWLSRYNAGVSVIPNDPEAFAKAMVDLASDLQRLKEMGQNAKRLAKEQFDRQRHMSRLESILRSVVIESPGEGFNIEAWPFKTNR